MNKISFESPNLRASKYLCPIALTLMKNPHSVSCCLTVFEKESIAPFVQKKCPQCHELVSHIIPNLRVRADIAECTFENQEPIISQMASHDYSFIEVTLKQDQHSLQSAIDYIKQLNVHAYQKQLIQDMSNVKYLSMLKHLTQVEQTKLNLDLKQTDLLKNVHIQNINDYSEELSDLKREQDDLVRNNPDFDLNASNIENVALVKQAFEEANKLLHLQESIEQMGLTWSEVLQRKKEFQLRTRNLQQLDTIHEYTNSIDGNVFLYRELTQNSNNCIKIQFCENNMCIEKNNLDYEQNDLIICAMQSGNVVIDNINKNIQVTIKNKNNSTMTVDQSVKLKGRLFLLE